MREKHDKVPWYSGDLQVPPVSSTSTSAELDADLPVVSVGVDQDVEAPEDTHDDDKSVDSSGAQPPTPSTEKIKRKSLPLRDTWLS